MEEEKQLVLGGENRKEVEQQLVRWVRRGWK